MTQLPPLDSDAQHVDTKTGKPTKDFFNWIKSVAGSALLKNNNLSDLEDPADARTNLGLGDIATHNASEFLSSTVPCFSVHKNGTNQTGIADVTSTTVTWGTEVYDVGGHFASDGWTPPAGKVAIQAGMHITGTFATSGVYSISVTKNGSGFKQGNSQFAAGWTSVGLRIAFEDVANGTDVYKVQVFADVSVGTITVLGDPSLTFFSGHWISP